MSAEELNTYLQTHSFLGSDACATKEDYKQCSLVKAPDAQKYPHLTRWHSLITVLSSKYPNFDWRGSPVPDGKAFGSSTASKKGAEPKAKAEPRAKAEKADKGKGVAKAKAASKSGNAVDEDAMRAVADQIRAVKERLVKQNITGKQLNDHPEIIALADKVKTLQAGGSPPATKEADMQQDLSLHQTISAVQFALDAIAQHRRGGCTDPSVTLSFDTAWKVQLNESLQQFKTSSRTVENVLKEVPQNWFDSDGNFAYFKESDLSILLKMLQSKVTGNQEAPPKKEAAPKKDSAPKKEPTPKKEAKKDAKKGDQSAAEEPVDRAKLLKKVLKEGGKRGVEIEGAADMGGLQFFCTSVEEPDGDLEMLQECLNAMNTKCDPTEEERKGGSGHIGKMIFSAGTSHLAIAAYVPEDKQGDLVSEDWLKAVLANFQGEVVSTSKTVSVGKVAANSDKGIFPLKIREPMIVEANNYLRKKGLFPEDKDSDGSDFVFGDDDFPS